MSTDFTVSIVDAALPIVQAILDADNDFRRREQTRPQITMAEMVQGTIESAYGITAGHLAVRERETKRGLILGKIDSADTRLFDAISEAIDTIVPRPVPVVDPVLDPIADPIVDPVVTP